jgi:hypothetical protein
VHTAGPKKDFDWRLACPERGHTAGFRRIGIGVLFGLWDWREEAIALAAHLDHLLRSCWKAHFTISLPRLRPAAGGFQPTHPLHDRDFVQMICAFRLHFPRVGFVLSTREPAALRDAVAPLGVAVETAIDERRPSLPFDAVGVEIVRAAAAALGHASLETMTVAGHDVLALQRKMPGTLIFVPSEGLSHNEREFTKAEDLDRGLDVLAETLWRMVTAANV